MSLMAKQRPDEQLDNIVEAIIANADSPLPRASSGVEPLVRIAVELRCMPREAYRARLKDELERRAFMAAAEKSVPEGFHTITPYLIVREAEELIEFVRQAFGAEELFRATGSAGGLHAEVQIGESKVMIGGGGVWEGTPSPAALLVYVDDVDATYKSALGAGATSMHEPVEEEYGDRDAGVEDPFGNRWYISTRRPLEHNPPDLRTIAFSLNFHGADRAIDFLKRAFGATEAYRAESPDGVILHSKMRIGDSILALSEAHGPFQPMPSTVYLYVNDVDNRYRQAVAEGAESLSEPADQPYGDRIAGVKDPFGNVWYIATHIAKM